MFFIHTNKSILFNHSSLKDHHINKLERETEYPFYSLALFFTNVKQGKYQLRKKWWQDMRYRYPEPLESGCVLIYECCYHANCHLVLGAHLYAHKEGKDWERRLGYNKSVGFHRSEVIAFYFHWSRRNSVNFTLYPWRDHPGCVYQIYF